MYRVYEYVTSGLRLGQHNHVVLSPLVVKRHRCYFHRRIVISSSRHSSTFNRPIETSMVEVSWRSILKKARESRTETGGDSVHVRDIEKENEFDIYLPKWTHQLSLYIDSFSIPRDEDTTFSQDEKLLIVETRAAIRFGLWCLSCCRNDEITNQHQQERLLLRRQELQTRMVVEYQWHHPFLSTLLSMGGNQNKDSTTRSLVDSKCRVLAAQLLSNLVTANPVPALKLFQSVPLSPSSQEVCDKILQQSSRSNDSGRARMDGLSDSPVTTTKATTTSGPTATTTSWVEMMVVCSRQSRDALAGVVAAFYNGIMALYNEDDHDEDQDSSVEEGRKQRQIHFGRLVASDSLLMSTLLRQFISVHAAIQPSMVTKTHHSDETNPSEAWDDATDWIVLLISRLSQWGFVPTMYRAVGSPEEGQWKDDSIQRKVLPEQLVLLHCTCHVIQSFVDRHEGIHERNPLGSLDGPNSSRESYVFLVNLFCRLQDDGDERDGGRRDIGVTPDNDNDKSDMDDIMEMQLRQSAALSCVQIISISLGADGDEMIHLREYFGTHTDLIPTSGRMLGRFVDDLTERSIGVKARDLKLSPEEQQWMVSLVRLIGNLAAGCHDNQDRIGMTLIPPSQTVVSTTTTQMGNRSGEDSTNSESDGIGNSVGINGVDAVRTLIHVVLTCTSFATSCLTLREWSVLAIHHLLHNHSKNQDLVANLEAEGPTSMTSKALEEAGIQFTLDSKTGSVSLTPSSSSSSSVMKETSKNTPTNKE